MSAAYFVPTDQEEEDLIGAARRGVDVRLLLPSDSDSKMALAIGRSHYADLLEAGVKIYEIQNEVLHSKTASIDGVWTAVGSSNFDPRSVVFNDEVDALVLGSVTATEFQTMFDGDTAKATQIDLADLAAQAAARAVPGDLRIVVVSLAELAVTRRSLGALFAGPLPFVGLLLLASPAPAATQLPRPPCGAEPIPGYPRPGEQPHVMLWSQTDLGPGWTAPSCPSWPAGAATIVVGLAGHFQYAGSADALLARIGAISSLSEVRYWSVTEKQWNNMFTRGVALDGPDLEKKRSDFSAAELRMGGTFYFAAADNRSGKEAVSRLRVIAADSAHFVLETENVTPLRWTILTYAAPGSFQTWYFLDRDDDGAGNFIV